LIPGKSTSRVDASGRHLEQHSSDQPPPDRALRSTIVHEQTVLEGIYKILYNRTTIKPKPIEFLGTALSDLRAFPLVARRDAGHQLDQVQRGREPDDWKPMETVGAGAKEIRIRDVTGAFRVIYVAKFAEAVYVMHCFQKKTAKTSKADLDLAAKRYRELVKERHR
jgi:phage-related protein